MPYIRLSDLAYPLYIGEIQTIHPEATIDNLPEGYEDVIVAPYPQLAEDEKAVETQPYLVDGKWHFAWGVEKMTPEEIAEKQAKLAELE